MGKMSLRIPRQDALPELTGTVSTEKPSDHGDSMQRLSLFQRLKAAARAGDKKELQALKLEVQQKLEAQTK